MAEYIAYKKCFIAKSKEEEEEDERTFQKYNNLISTFPREEGLTIYGQSEGLYQYEGFWYEDVHCHGVLAAQDHFNARSSDILLASTLKTGATWLKSLIFAVVTRKSYPISESPLLTINPHLLLPQLEKVIYSKKRITKPDILPSPRLFSTHMPYTSLPQSILDSGSRIVYASRNPKDTFFSIWHFINKIRAKDSKMPLTVEDAFEYFCKGTCTFGPFWDHVLGYWKASLDKPQNVLFLKYEEVQAEPAIHLKRMAEFMGCPFTSEEEVEGAIEEIIRLCSFENMSSLEVNKNGKTSTGLGFNSFFRKGKTGDGAQNLKHEMIERLDQITEQKFHGHGLAL